MQEIQELQKRMEGERSRKKKKGCRQVQLPGEIIEEILLRIPAEYLVGLKAVCKDWFSLISCRDFAKAHLACHCGEFQQILVRQRPAMFVGILCQIRRSIDAEDPVYNLGQMQLQELLGTILAFWDSCDGLLLYKSRIPDSTLYVCNPVTRKCSAVPLPETRLFVENWRLVHDVSIEKYKIIGIASRSHICYQFILNNNEEGSQWKELVVRQRPCVSQTSPAPVNNDLHWLASEEVDSKPFLCSMDVAREQFRETQIPFLSRYEPKRNNVIGVMGSLCLSDYLPDHNELHIWCLEDREKGVWTKKYSAKCEFQLGRYVSFHSYPSAAPSTESRIIIRHEKQIFVYDSATNIWKKTKFLVKEGEMSGCYNFVHINSLIEWG